MLVMPVHKSQIRKIVQNTAQLCLKTFNMIFYYVQTLIRALYSIFVRRKVMYLWTCRSFESAYEKTNGSSNRTSVKCHICGRSANPANYLSPQVVKLRFAKHICGRPCSFGICNPFSRVETEMTGRNHAENFPLCLTEGKM
jgi:hypothetical protein